MRIFDNLLYKVVSILIACVLWAAAQGVTDVEQSLDVPIAVEKVPESLVVVEESAHEINLRLVGSRAALRQAVKTLQHYTVSREGVTDRIEPARLRETSVLESSVALGYPHVWRKDPDAGPIRVSVEIEPVGRSAGE